MMFFVDDLPPDDLKVVRKHFDHKLRGGPALTSDESRHYWEISRQRRRQEITDVGVFMLLAGTVLWLIIQRAP